MDLGKGSRQDKFRYVKMALGAKHMVGGRGMNYHFNLGKIVMKSDLYVMILGFYDIMIDMDWLELHEAILHCKMKRLRLTDDEG
jgi:hypothetical protein